MSIDPELAIPRMASVEDMAATIQKVEALGLLVIGSVGRAAIFNDLTGDPDLEFAAREPAENPLATRLHGIHLPRDVDTIGGDIPDAGDAHWLPHAADSQAFYNGNINVVKDDKGDWWVERATGPGATMERKAIDPLVFEPFRGTTVHGIPCTTVRPATHAVLLAAASCRSNDIIAAELLARYMPDREHDLYNTPPFRLFRKQIQM